MAPHIGQIIESFVYIFEGRQVPGLYDLVAHVGGWEPYSLHDPAHASSVGSVLYR